MDQKIVRVLQDLRTKPIALDAVLFPKAPPLFPHQRILFRTFEDYLFVWLEAARGAGKSYTLARWLINYLLRHPGRTAIISGPSLRQSRLPFKFAKELIFGSTAFPWQTFLTKEPIQSTESSFMQFTNGSAIMALPASGTKLHGQRGNILVLTEFFDYEELLYSMTVLPMLAVRTAGEDNRIIYESTAGFEFSFAFQVLSEFKKSVREGDRDYRYLSFTVDHLLKEGFPIDRKIVNTTRRINEDVYAQQYQNRWLSDFGAFYTLSAMKRPELKTGKVLSRGKPEKEYVMALDVARSFRGKGDDCALAVIEAGHIPKVVYMWADNNITADQLAKEVENRLDRFKGTLRLCIDFKGGGFATVDKLYEKGYIAIDEPAGVDGKRIIVPFPNTSEAINEGHQWLRAAFENDRISLPERPESSNAEATRIYDEIESAFHQLADLKTERLQSGYLRFEAAPNKKRDKGYALMYAFWALQKMLRERGPEVADLGEDAAISSNLGEILIGLRPTQ